MTSLTLRPYLPDDADALWALLEPVLRAGETYALPRDITRADALAYWTGGAVHLAEQAGAVIGASRLCANQRGGGDHVANAAFVVAETARGRGVARRLCAHALDQAARRGFRAMQFNFVIETNRGAVALWRKLGFEIAGRLPGAFRHPSDGYVDALVMFRHLSPN